MKIYHEGLVYRAFRPVIGGPHRVRFGLFPLLSKESRQLLITLDYGGMRSFIRAWVYDLRPQLTAVFDNEPYYPEFGATFKLADLDGDGIYEIQLGSYNWRYFLRSCGSCSAHPSAVFRYDSDSGRYLPAPKEFSKYYLDSFLERSRKRFAEVKSAKGSDHQDPGGDYLGAVLQVVLDYVYAGHEAEGWEFFDREYGLDDKEEVRAAVKKHLAEDRYYQAISAGSTESDRE